MILQGFQAHGPTGHLQLSRNKEHELARTDLFFRVTIISYSDKKKCIFPPLVSYQSIYIIRRKIGLTYFQFSFDFFFHLLHSDGFHLHQIITNFNDLALSPRTQHFQLDSHICNVVSSEYFVSSKPNRQTLSSRWWWWWSYKASHRQGLTHKVSHDLQAGEYRLLCPYLSFIQSQNGEQIIFP